jgi:hypothetical protein
VPTNAHNASVYTWIYEEDNRRSQLSQELIWLETFPQGLVDDTLTEYAFVARIDPTMTSILVYGRSLGSSSTASATCPNHKKNKTTHNHQTDKRNTFGSHLLV